MDYLTLAAGIWISVFVVLGVARGFWKALAAILSLVGAYLAAAFFAPQLSAFFLRVFAQANLGEAVTWAASATLIFMLAGLVIRLVVVLVARSRPIANRSLNAVSGAVLSGAYGAVLALVTVWGVSFLMETYRSQRPELAEPQRATPAVVTLSRAFMADIVGWNARRSGASEQTAQLASAYARQPKEVLDAVQNSVRSQEFRQVLSSERVQRFVREQNVEELQRSEEFQQLLKQPAVQHLRQMVAAGEAELSDEAVAEQLMEVWGGVDELRNSPEMIALFDDPEVKAFLNEGGKVTPALLVKGQEFLKAIAIAAPAKPESIEAPELYQWFDDNDQLQVTEYDAIPADKREQAKRIPL